MRRATGVQTVRGTRVLPRSGPAHLVELRCARANIVASREVPDQLGPRLARRAKGRTGATPGPTPKPSCCQFGEYPRAEVSPARPSDRASPYKGAHQQPGRCAAAPPPWSRQYENRRRAAPRRRLRQGTQAPLFDWPGCGSPGGNRRPRIRLRALEQSRPDRRVASLSPGQPSGRRLGEGGRSEAQAVCPGLDTLGGRSRRSDLGQVCPLSAHYEWPGESGEVVGRPRLSLVLSSLAVTRDRQTRSSRSTICFVSPSPRDNTMRRRILVQKSSTSARLDPRRARASCFVERPRSPGAGRASKKAAM